ncbi:MAG: hypothetical protein DCO96_01805 [Fluviicola sp. XM-24bin1]|nr:MAG: hypothetical protein DCO96_01805 [Fluviicola sp. XM-24bin1]
MKSSTLLMVLVFVFTAGLASAQGKVEWGDLEKSTGRLIDVIPDQGENFYALRRSGGALFGRLEGSYHKNLELITKGKLELRANDSPANFEAATMVGDKFVVFLSDRQEGENKFFMQEYGQNIEPTSEAEELGSYILESKRRRFQGTFNLYQSESRDYFAVVWTIPGKREEQATYGFKVFDADLELLNEGEYEVPFEEQFSTIDGFYLSDFGDLFVTITEYKESEEKKLFRNFADYVSVHIYHLKEGDIEEMEIDLDGKRVEAMSFNSDNERIFVITGIYGDKEASGVKGLFYLKADFKKQSILNEGFEEFGEDFIMSDWSDRQKKKQEKKEKKGKAKEPTLYSYIMREVHPMEDGSIVGTMEQYYVRVVTNYNAQTGTTTTTYYYYYNDVVVYKVGSDGGFEWLAKVDKYQVSTNDGGYFSSYARYVDGEKLVLFFNDNSDNYNEVSGEFELEPGKSVRSSRLSKKKNTVAICEIDLETGEVSREMYFDREELGAIVVPKLFNVDYRTNEMLFYAIRGKKEQFGRLVFGE